MVERQGRSPSTMSPARGPGLRVAGYCDPAAQRWPGAAEWGIRLCKHGGVRESGGAGQLLRGGGHVCLSKSAVTTRRRPRGASGWRLVNLHHRRSSRSTEARPERPRDLRLHRRRRWRRPSRRPAAMAASRGRLKVICTHDLRYPPSGSAAARVPGRTSDAWSIDLALDRPHRRPARGRGRRGAAHRQLRDSSLIARQDRPARSIRAASPPTSGLAGTPLAFGRPRPATAALHLPLRPRGLGAGSATASCHATSACAATSPPTMATLCAPQPWAARIVVLPDLDRCRRRRPAAASSISLTVEPRSFPNPGRSGRRSATSSPKLRAFGSISGRVAWHAAAGQTASR